MTDQEIILKAQEGNQQAFFLLYDKYAETLYRFVCSLSRDGAAEDIVQQSFIQAFKNLYSFQGKSRFGTWLFGIAVNQIKMEYRSKNAAFSSEEIKHENDIEQDSQLFEWKQTMRIWLDDLDELPRSVFTLFEVEGFSHKEIAIILGISESHSRTVLSRTKKVLQQKWKKEVAS